MAPCEGQDEAPGSGPALVIGATGYIGRFIAEACLNSGRKTFILVRPGNACVEALRHKGAVIVESRVDGKDKEGSSRFLETVLRAHGIEVVISAIGGRSILDQLGFIEAIKAAGTVKRFLPSEFGHDVDRALPVGAGLGFYELKRYVRRAAEAAGVPYTYICCNSIAGWPYIDNIHPSEVTPPLDRFQIYGDGTVRAFFVAGPDIGKFTVMAAHDRRCADKVVHFRPACNLLSTEEMACLWESKIGRTLPRVTLSEQDLLAMAARHDIIPASIVASLTHDIFINGCQTNYAIEDDGSRDVEVSKLYPDVPFTTVDQCFDDYVQGIRIRLEEKEEEATEKKEKSNPPMVAA